MLGECHSAAKLVGRIVGGTPTSSHSSVGGGSLLMYWPAPRSNGASAWRRRAAGAWVDS